ncbi:hypothetical protein KEM48_002039 [Puccinia striiformis f. sp. tritici PST-130]|nr:hypothetical protein KEM48_002039 [Puccinia striiformis f. sp. tritici PST-130]
MLSIPSLILLLAAYSSAETTSAEPNPYTYVCAKIDGKDKLMGSLNPERKFVRDDQKTSKVEPSGDCQCTINIPSLLTCQEPITNSPYQPRVTSSVARQTNVPDRPDRLLVPLL